MTPAGAQHAQEPEIAAIQPVNLLADRHATKQEVFAKSRRLLLASVAIVVLSSAMIIPMQIGAAAKRHSAARMGNELTVVAARREKAQSRAAQVAASEELLGKLKEESSKTRLWRNLLAELSCGIGGNTWLAGLNGKLESSQTTVEIRGSAESLTSATRFTRTLKSSPFFDQAKLASTQSTGGAAGESVTHFECKATLSEEAVKGAGQDVPLKFGADKGDTGDQD